MAVTGASDQPELRREEAQLACGCALRRSTAPAVTIPAAAAFPRAAGASSPDAAAAANPEAAHPERQARWGWWERWMPHRRETAERQARWGWHSASLSGPQQRRSAARRRAGSASRPTSVSRCPSAMPARTDSGPATSRTQPEQQVPHALEVTVPQQLRTERGQQLFAGRRAARRHCRHPTLYDRLDQKLRGAGLEPIRSEPAFAGQQQHMIRIVRLLVAEPAITVVPPAYAVAVQPGQLGC